MLESRHIQVFAEVARTGTFSGAARALGYTQPAISQQMRALERSVGAALFVRSGRVLRLTDAGRILARHAEEILATIGAAEKQVAAFAKLQEGRIRVCAFPSASATIIPTALARIRTDHPGVRVELVEEEPPTSVEGLKSGNWDLAVSFSYPGFEASEDPDLYTLPLIDDPLVVLLPDGHPLAGHRSIELPQLRSENWIAGCARCRSHVLALCANAGFEPAIEFSTDDNLAVQNLVASGIGIAVMPGMVQSFLRHPGVVSRPLAPASARTISAHTLAGHQDIVVTRFLLEALRRAAHQLSVRDGAASALEGTASARSVESPGQRHI